MWVHIKESDLLWFLEAGGNKHVGFDKLVCFNKTCLSVLIRCKVKAKVCYFEIVPKNFLNY